VILTAQSPFLLAFTHTMGMAHLRITNHMFSDEEDVLVEVHQNYTLD